MPRSLSRLLFHLLLGFAACASMSRSQVPNSAAAETSHPRSEIPDAGSPDGAASAGVARTAGVDGAAGAAPSATTEAPDRGAEADFGAARARFDRGDSEGARLALEAFVARHPGHASRGTAEVLLGRLALGRGDPATAKKLLGPLVTGTPDGGSVILSGTSARYYLGLAELRLGNMASARQLLSPFLPKGAGTPLDPADDLAVELRGALAEASAPGDPIGALELWESYLRIAREHEKTWARARASEIGMKMAPEMAWRAYGAAPPAGLARAVLGAKAASYLRARGDASGATFIETEASAARHALGFDVAGPRVGPGDPTRFGLVIPLSGKFQVVGEAALRAAMLAGGVPGQRDSAPGAGGPQLLVRDTATDAARAARGVADLTRTEAVIGIVGVASAKTGTAAIGQATEDGVALLALEDAAPGALTTGFQIVHAPEARAAALARQALKLGVRRFALLGPDSVSGKRLRDAFRKAVTEGGGNITAEASYVAGATSFAAAIAPLKKSPVEAIFVPDSAERLSLIAPALAVADLWPQAWGRPRQPGQGGKGQPRSVLLLSTANELSHKLVDSAGRYVQGALLCPGFFADDGDPRARGFVEAYRAAYGGDPHATEAYAYDAVAVLRAVTGRGARTRGDVLKALGGVGGAPVLQGLTGNVAFGPDHSRVDSPLVYVVDGDIIRATR